MFPVLRRQRRHVRILAKTEKNQIQHRLAMSIRADHFSDFRLRLLRSTIGTIFPSQAMDFVRRNFQRNKQFIIRQLEIALRIRRRNTAFVCPEKIHLAERHLSRCRLLHHRGEKFLRDSPARQRHVMRGRYPVGPLNFIHPRLAACTKANSSGFAK